MFGASCFSVSYETTGQPQGEGINPCDWCFLRADLLPLPASSVDDHDHNDDNNHNHNDD